MTVLVFFSHVFFFLVKTFYFSRTRCSTYAGSTQNDTQITPDNPKKKKIKNKKTGYENYFHLPFYPTKRQLSMTFSFFFNILTKTLYL